MKVKIKRMKLDTNRYPVLVDEDKQYVCDGRKDFSSPENIAAFCFEQLRLHEEPEEHVWGIGMNVKNQIMGVFEIAHGASDCAMFYMKQIFQRLLLMNASRFIMVHNHPSGDPSPSGEDYQIADKVAEAGKLLDIPMIDNIIIGEETYFSFSKFGLLKGGKG